MGGSPSPHLQVVGEWQYFDANHTFERTFRWPIKDTTKGLRNPWKTYVPTITGSSSMTGRVLKPDNTIQFRKVHGLEAMQMIG